MLGKLIKNEFRFRGKVLIKYSIVLLALSAVFSLLGVILNSLSGSAHETFSIFIEYYSTLLSAATIGLAVLAAVLFAKDYIVRYTSEKSYLTHTLPVNEGMLVNARLISDIILTLFVILMLLLTIVTASHGEHAYYGYSTFKHTLFQIRELPASELFERTIVTAAAITLAFKLLWWFYLMNSIVMHSKIGQIQTKITLWFIFILIIDITASFLSVSATKNLAKFICNKYSLSTSCHVSIGYSLQLLCTLLIIAAIISLLKKIFRTKDLI